MKVGDHVLATLNWGSGDAVYEVKISKVEDRVFSGLYRCPDNFFDDGEWIGPGAFAYDELVAFEMVARADE